MQIYQPQTIIAGRFLLKELLEANAEWQLWAVTDQKTGQPLIGRFYANNKTEWYNDNRNVTKNALPYIHPVTTHPPRLGDTPPKRGSGWVLVLFLMTGFGIAGYYNQDLLQKWYNDLRMSGFPELSGNTPVSENTAADLNNPKKGFPDWQPDHIPENEFSVSARRSAVPAKQHDPFVTLSVLDLPDRPDMAAFTDSRERLKAQMPAMTVSRADSLKMFIMGNASRHYVSYGQNKDNRNRLFALEWFKTAEALFPETQVKNRIDELMKPESSSKSIRKATGTSEPVIFIDDPELKKRNHEN